MLKKCADSDLNISRNVVSVRIKRNTLPIDHFFATTNFNTSSLISVEIPSFT